MAEQMQDFDGSFQEFKSSMNKQGSAFWDEQTGRFAMNAATQALKNYYSNVDESSPSALLEKLWNEQAGEVTEKAPENDPKTILNKIIAGGYDLEEAGNKLDQLGEDLEAAGTLDQYEELIEQALAKFMQMDAELGDN